MYNGSNKAALLSQKMISDALLRLLESRAYSDITISDLCKEAQVSRQTFYSAFGTKENVITHELKNNCSFVPQNVRKHCKSAVFREFCSSYSNYIIDKSHILGLLVRNDMMHFLYEVQYRSFMECEHFFPDVTGDDRVYLIDFITSGMNSIAKNYIMTGCTADKAVLEKLMFRLYGGMYFTE